VQEGRLGATIDPGPDRGEPDETVDGQSGASGGSPGNEPADLKLEVVVIPVADAERSKTFYAGLGWRLDADFSFDNGFRVQSAAAFTTDAGADGTAMTMANHWR
jgi:hypothetical protein